MKTSTTHSYCEDDTPDESDDFLHIDGNKNGYLIDGDSHFRKRIPQVDSSSDKDSDSIVDSDEAIDRQIDDDDDEDMECDLFESVGNTSSSRRAVASSIV